MVDLLHCKQMECVVFGIKQQLISSEDSGLENNYGIQIAVHFAPTNHKCQVSRISDTQQKS